MDCYFRQKWLDERLAFSPFGSREDLPLASKMLKDIWTPDTSVLFTFISSLFQCHSIVQYNISIIYMLLFSKIVPKSKQIKILKI